MKCVACRKDAPTVTDAELAGFHPQVSDWEIAELDGIKRLRRVFSFDDFAQVFKFTKKVGELAEEEGHHPALLTEWGSTTVTWWTHKIKGLYRNDFIMTAKTRWLKWFKSKGFGRQEINEPRASIASVG